MSDVTPVSLEELFNETASASALAEANAFRTVPTNYYKIQGTSFSANRNAKGRLVINCKADVLKEDKKVGTVSFYVSSEAGRTSTGRLDREFRLYSQMVRVLYPDIKDEAQLAQLKVGDVLQKFTTYPVGAFITETFASDPSPIDGKKTYFDAKTEAEAKEYREKGWKASNYVQSIGKVK